MHQTVILVSLLETNRGTAMYAVTVTFQIKPDRMADFLPLMMENARASVETEGGCRQFDVCRDKNEATVFLYELYDDLAAFNAHIQTDHFKVLNDSIDGMVVDKEIRTFDQVMR